MSANRSLAIALTFALLAAGAACSSTSNTTSGATPSEAAAAADPAQAAEIMTLVESEMAARHLRSVIVKVSVDGEEVVREARGDSMTGVPATPEMSFRNGAVAISYVATLLLTLVDAGKVSLDDKVSTYLPELNHAGEVTVGQLARMTSGYPDHVTDPAFVAANSADPFRLWTVDEILAYVIDKPLSFEPGSNWGYAHTNYLILGLVIEKITGRPMAEVMQAEVLDPLGLDHTVASQTAAIPEPVLHSFSSERRADLGIAPDAPFTEESTFWNPSWSITQGAVQTSTIDDFDRSAIAIGTGELLSPESYEAMISTDLRGFGHVQEGCSCGPMSEFYSYGIGLVTSGDWVLQNPLFSGYASLMAYLPEQKVAISVAVTFEPGAFGADGAYANSADAIFREIGAIMAPDAAPPTRP
ncbi:serine hydrolase domain-containing protein [Tomitella biformata]|uniref:serine hydrolase domain-containing protein n=1 Tax=Tomitella biformata TaxID=630403 RepID=UPI0004647043|nr:serine hydrolase domain-containing protein [Tomitella biformata]